MRKKGENMAQIILKALIIMLVLFAFAVPGFVLRKTNLVRSDSLYSISNILLCVAQPALIVKAFAVDPIAPTGAVLLNFLWVFLFSAAAVFLTFGAGLLITIPASYLILICMEFVNYCDGNEIKYFIDKHTIIKPDQEKETSREQFLKGE